MEAAREGIRDINCDKKLLVNNWTVPVLQQFLIVPPDTKMRLRSLYRLLETVVSVLLDFLTSEAECEDRPQVPGGRSLNTAFCSYIGGKLDTKVTSVRQKQVRGV